MPFFVFDLDTFKIVKEFKYQKSIEGWGLTHDNSNLIMSDGSSTLTVFEPANFSKVGQIDVRENGQAVKNLNELEYVDGFSYANIWMTNTIVKIDAKTGAVVGKRDFSELEQDAAQSSSSEILEMNILF